MCTEAGEKRSAVFVWCTSVQSGTVSVHPILGLVWWGFFHHCFCDPPAPPSGWGGAESLSLSVSEFSSLLQFGGSQLLISHRPNTSKPIHLPTCSCLTFYLFSIKSHLNPFPYFFINLRSPSFSCTTKGIYLFGVAAWFDQTLICLEGVSYGFSIFMQLNHAAMNVFFFLTLSEICCCSLSVLFL